jgi:hypothetical protein
MSASDLRAPEPITLSCNDTLDAVYELSASLPPFDATRRGDVFHCAYEGYVSASDANAALTSYGYLGAPVANGMDIYRIAFRTRRSAPASRGTDGGTPEGPEGFSSARVFFPDQRRPEAYVVTAHGTAGEGAPCVDSKRGVLDPANPQSSKIFNLALAGNGWLVIEPDYAGYGYGQAPHGWSLAEDEAHSVLDATRAMKQLVDPSQLPAKVFFLGHSQGSHAVLSAQAFARSYGMEGQLIGVVPMAVLWISDLTWGASLSSLAMLTTQHDAAAISYGMFYFYGHGELYDGPGGGLTMFQAAKRNAVKAIMENNCEEDMTTVLPSLGSTTADIYDPAFISAMESCMVYQTGCGQEPAATWVGRAIADRPPIDPDGAPIVAWHGAKDIDISPSRAQCGFDKIRNDLARASQPTATFTICGDPEADHGGVIQRDVDWVTQWMAARATGQPDPPGCPGPGPLQPPGGTLTCAVPPLNQ